MSEADWEERHSSTHNRKYWYNLVTQQSVWVDPRPALRASATTTTANTSASGSSSSSVPVTSTTQAAKQDDTTEEHESKRARHDQTSAPDVVTTSYRPPESGAAVDMKAVAEKKLPRPRIRPTLPPAPAGTDMWTRNDIQVNQVLAKTYRDGFIIDAKGVKQKFKDITNPLQGRHMYNMIVDNKFTHTLEVGLAMGASACWITQAHKDNNLNGHHIAIDPNQTAQYECAGKNLVQQCGNIQYLEVMEMTSYRALPILFERVRKGEIPKFDLIYIDGWHTFDYTLVDFFYADLLLNVHGIIVLDDIKHIPVKRCFDYIAKNYSHYEVVPQTPVYDPTNKDTNFRSSQATFIKTANDTRTWNHHVDF